MTVVKRAVLKHKDGRQQEFFLFRVEEKVFRWADSNGKLWDGVDYTSENIALKGIRVSVDTDPALVGVDLTVYPVEPAPEERAAKARREQPAQAGRADPQGRPGRPVRLAQRGTRVQQDHLVRQVRQAHPVRPAQPDPRGSRSTGRAPGAR